MIKKSGFIAVCGLLACLLCAGTAAADADAGDELRAREVRVTATRTERDLMEVPMSVGVVTGEDQIRNPQTSVADMLSGIPGVNVMDGGMPGGKRIMIRGESPMRSLILIDGMKVSEQKSMSGSAILIDTSQIERIEVIKGPASVLYGSEAIGGVINIITKKGGDRPIGFSQNVGYDSSNNAWDIQSALFGSYNGFNYRFTASGLNAHNRWDGDEVIHDSQYKTRNYSGQVGYDWAKGSVYLRADRYESEIGIPTSYSENTYEFGMSAGRKYKESVALHLSKWDRKSLSGGVELRDLSDFLARVKLNLSMQNMEKDFKNRVETTAGTFMGDMYVLQNINTLNDQDSYGGSLQTEWTLGRNHYVTAGVDYNLDKLDAKTNTRGMLKPPPVPFPYPTGPTYKHQKLEQWTLGAFVQDEWTFHPDWTATLGLRETWVTSKFTEGGDATFPEGDKSDSHLVGNVASSIPASRIRRSGPCGRRATVSLP